MYMCVFSSQQYACLAFIYLLSVLIYSRNVLGFGTMPKDDPNR